MACLRGGTGGGGRTADAAGVTAAAAGGSGSSTGAGTGGAAIWGAAAEGTTAVPAFSGSGDEICAPVRVSRFAAAVFLICCCTAGVSFSTASTAAASIGSRCRSFLLTPADRSIFRYSGGKFFKFSAAASPALLAPIAAAVAAALVAAEGPPPPPPPLPAAAPLSVPMCVSCLKLPGTIPPTTSGTLLSASRLPLASSLPNPKNAAILLRRRAGLGWAPVAGAAAAAAGGA